MAYTKTTWVNDQSPDIDADNLNKMEQGIYDAQFPDGGTEGQLLARTANGRGWVDPPNSAVWGGIAGDIADQTDLQESLSTKMTTPSGGTTGQVLTKTASGYDWQTGGSGGTWGSITGTLSDQTDLQNALDAKSNIGNIATIETSPATATHAVGSYIVWNGQLYSVIDAIDVGQNLTVGSNITATSAGSELTSLKNGLIYENFSSRVTAHENLNSARFERLGKIVTFSVQGETKARAENDIIATLPSGYRPSGTYFYAGTLGNYVCVFSLNANGELKIWTASTYPTGRAYISGAFIIA